MARTWLPLTVSPNRAVEPYKFARLLYYMALIPLSATAFRPLMGFTLSDWLFLLALMAMIMEMVAARGSVHGLPWLLVYGVAIFIAGGVVSSVNATYPAESFGVLARFIYLTLIWFWLGTMVLRNNQQVTLAVALWTLSAALAACAAIAQALWGYDAVPAVIAGPGFYGREAGITLHPNDVGALTSFALVPCLVLLSRQRANGLRILYSVALVLLIAGLIVSGSVGGFVAAVVGVLVWTLMFRGASRLLLLLSAAAGIVGWLGLTQAASLPFASPLIRIQEVTGDSSTASLVSRLQLDAQTLDIVLRQPIIGIGLDNASQSIWLFTRPENMFLLAWFGGGLLGLIGLTIVVLSCLREGLRKLGAVDRDLCAGLLISFVSALVFSLASPILQQRYLWIAAALLLCVRPLRTAPGRAYRKVAQP